MDAAAGRLKKRRAADANPIAAKKANAIFNGAMGLQAMVAEQADAAGRATARSAELEEKIAALQAELARARAA